MTTRHRLPEETPEAPKDNRRLAHDAIAHTLHAICSSPAKFWLMGNGTESYAQLTAAFAALRGEPVEEVREYFLPNPVEYAAFNARRDADQEALELAATLAEIAGTTDPEELTRLVSLGRHFRESNGGGR